MEFLVGLDMHATEPDALQSLYELSCTNKSISLYCFASLSAASIYHPKMYLFRDGDEATSIIGSSNLTRGGLQRNIEVSVLLEGSSFDDAISDTFTTYNQLKMHPKRAIPDDEYVRLYEEVSKAGRESRRKYGADTDYKDLLAKFNEKGRSLRRPQLDHRELVGWSKLVYDALPDDVFTNAKVFELEHIFQLEYPNNKTVRAKIRQQLQFLAKMKLIRHIGTGLWCKL